jgi:hypothetical protein
MDSLNDYKQLFTLINSFQASTTPNKNINIKCIQDHHGLAKFDTKEIHDVFYQYWHDMFSNDEKQTSIEDFDLASFVKLTGACNSKCNNPISVSEIKAALKSIKRGKALGIDDIPSIFLNESRTLISALQRLFNKVFSSGKFPSQWKIDRRIPLHKKGSKVDVSHYRLIAIHSIFRKLFATILDKRIRSFITLSDTQCGFRPGRRCTDHAFVIRDTIRSHFLSRRSKDLYVVIIDFSKAFDRCHIPTLLSKLAHKGVRGKLLSIIADMYTDAYASIQINNSIGKKFKVSRGVAQGCVLSPILFNIYLDDLLQKFTDSGLGVPINYLLFNAFSFADDLALIATDQTTVDKYLDIINDWCNECFFEVNMDKSGVMRLARLKDSQNDCQLSQSTVDNDSPHQNSDFTLAGLPLKNLTEIKYLGFDIDNKGSYDHYLHRIIQKSTGILAKFYPFLSSYNIPFKLRLKAANALIISHLSYGQEIIPLTHSQLDAIEKVLLKTLRTVFHQPIDAKASALHLIYGQSRLKYTRMRSRINNYLRIGNLPHDRSIQKLANAELWSAKSYTVGRYSCDLGDLEFAMKRFSSFNQSSFDHILYNYRNDSNLSNTMIKQILNNYNHAEIDINTLNSHASSLLQFFTPSRHHPVLDMSGVQYSKLISWMIAATDLYQDRQNQDRYHNLPHNCRLCHSSTSHESRQHLLTDCPSTIHLIESFSSYLRLISSAKYQEFCSLPYQTRWLWILGSGTINNRNLFHADAKNYKYQAVQSPFTKGLSVNHNFNKKDSLQCYYAYTEFKQIEFQLPQNSLVIYTDGSHRQSLSGS